MLSLPLVHFRVGSNRPFRMVPIYGCRLQGLYWLGWGLSERQCVHCGYNLTGNVTGMCLECGNKIESP